MPSSARLLSRLFTLLLLLPLIGYHCAASANDYLKEVTKDTIGYWPGSTPIGVKVRLTSQCTDLLVRVKLEGQEGRGRGKLRHPSSKRRRRRRRQRQDVDALGRRMRDGHYHQNTILELVSQGHNGNVTIRGTYSGKYLCFTNNGRLKTRPPRYLERHKSRCVFQEEPAGVPGHVRYFVRLRSKTWYLGFNRRGRKMKGFKFLRLPSKSKRRACFNFFKNNTLHSRPSPPDKPSPMGRVRESLLHKLFHGEAETPAKRPPPPSSREDDSPMAEVDDAFLKTLFSGSQAPERRPHLHRQRRHKPLTLSASSSSSSSLSSSSSSLSRLQR